MAAGECLRVDDIRGGEDLGLELVVVVVRGFRGGQHVERALSLGDELAPFLFFLPALLFGVDGADEHGQLVHKRGVRAGKRGAGRAVQGVAGVVVVVVRYLGDGVLVGQQRAQHLDGV